MRIVSLLPSATEVICALGLAEQLVGVSYDGPAGLEDKPALIPTVPVVASWEHDASVHQGHSVYHVSQDELAALRPDLVLSQERCGLCTPRYSDKLQAANVLEHEHHVVSLEPTTLDDVWAHIELLGSLTHTQTMSRAVLTAMRERVEAIENQASLAEDSPRVLCLIEAEPLIFAGRWLPEMVELCGGQPYAQGGEPPDELGWDERERFNPDILLLSPDNADPERTAYALDELSSHEGWDELSAVKHDQVYLFHDARYLNRPGPRLVSGLELLAKVVQPTLFQDVSVPQGVMYKVGR